MADYNLHTHTTRCHHAVGEDREYVEAAIKAGLKTLGFADHCPQFFPVDDYYSHFRMFPEQAQEYAESIRALQKEYASDIHILLGFETEYYPETFDKLIEFVKPLHLDYMIMGQHFVGNEYDEGSYYVAERGKKEEYLAQYVAQVKEGLSTGAFTYLAHPDIVWYVGEEAFYRQQMSDLCRFALERDIPLEYNLLGYVNGRSYPTPAFWDIAAATGNKVVIGFDAHHPDMLLSSGVYNACVDRLAAHGITPVSFDKITIRPIVSD
jgi:histidinol-phosphatase (PHP family)